MFSQFALNLNNRLVWNCDELSWLSCKDRGAAWSWIRSRPSAQRHGVDLPVMDGSSLFLLALVLRVSGLRILPCDTRSQQTPFLSPVDVWK